MFTIRSSAALLLTASPLLAQDTTVVLIVNLEAEAAKVTHLRPDPLDIGGWTLVSEEALLDREGNVVARSRGVPEEELLKVANAALPLGGGTMLMATDAVVAMGQELKKGKSSRVAGASGVRFGSAPGRRP